MKLLYLANIRLPTEKAHGVQIMKMCEAFARAGQDVTLVVTNRRSALREDPFSYYGVDKKFKIVRLPTIDTVRFGRIGFTFESLAFSFSALIYLCIHPADIIFSRDEVVLWPISFFKRNIVWESHDGAWNRAARQVAHRARLLVTTTSGAKDFYAEQGVLSEKILIAPNGIDVEGFAAAQSKEDARKRLGLPQDKKIAMYIGRLDGWKGADTLLQASGYVNDVLLAVIGGEPEQIAAAKTRYPRVRFLGPRPYRELPDNQSAADALIVPNTGSSLISVRFTSPLKLLAHMASSRAIVASDLPSIREIARNCVRYVVPDDPRALAEAIREVCADTAHAQKLADAAKERVASFSWSERAEKISTRLCVVLSR